jgi:hypothetical protein
MSLATARSSIAWRAINVPLIVASNGVARDGCCIFAPAVTYRLQRAASATGPWSNIATNTAPASGLIEYHETTPPPGQAFYRTLQP